MDWQASSGNCWLVTSCGGYNTGVTTGGLAGIALYIVYPVIKIQKTGTSNCLDSHGSNGNVIIGNYGCWSGNTNTYQQWLKVPSGGSFYNLVNVANGGVIDDDRGDTSNGARLKTFGVGTWWGPGATTSDFQNFAVPSTGSSGWVSLKKSNPNYCLDGGGSDGAQIWTCNNGGGATWDIIGVSG